MGSGALHGEDTTMSQVLTDNNDTVFFASQNVVYALDGEDIVFSSQTSPVLYGGDGGDALGNRGIGEGHLYGGRGNDAIHGGTTVDHLYGGDGPDLLVGGGV
jgi:Ca2+-binding RTX toxin-like protein